MEYLYALAVAVLVALLLVSLLRSPLWPRRLTVFEYERGLRYRGGHFDQVVGAGQYWVTPWSTTIVKVDLRPRMLPIGGQEVLTADAVAIKSTLIVKYEVADPVLAIHGSQEYNSALYSEIQLGLREVIGALKVGDLLSQRGEIGRRVTELAAVKGPELGLRVHAVEVRDITFPGELKKVFSQVVKARQDGLAALEKARGETAALRNLANAARLVEDKPALLQLRLLQHVADGSGNTLMVGMPPLPASAPSRATPPSPGDRIVGEEGAAE